MTVEHQLIVAISVSSLILVGMLYIIYLLKKKPTESKQKVEQLEAENKNLTIEVSKKDQEIGTLGTNAKTLNNENNDVKGQLKQLEKTNKNLESEIEKLKVKTEEQQEKLIKFESTKEQRQTEHDEMINKLEAARETLEKEKERVRSEAEEKQKKEVELLNRIWKEHEDKVIATLTDLCQKKEINFKSYDNNNMPSDWEDKRKPDFMIEFLDQFLIFDAKLSKKPEDLQNYIANQQVELTYNKIKNNSKIYPTIYLVVPSEAIGFISQFHYFVHGYNFFVITIESLEPLLLNLKEITKYDLADKFDPQDRESIINAISELGYHINLRNAADLTLTQWGVETLERAKNFNQELFKEVALKTEKMDIKAINRSHLKRFMLNTDAQQKEINRLSTPVAPVLEKDIKEAKTLLLEDNSEDDAS